MSLHMLRNNISKVSLCDWDPKEELLRVDKEGGEGDKQRRHLKKTDPFVPENSSKVKVASTKLTASDKTGTQKPEGEGEKRSRTARRN